LVIVATADAGDRRGRITGHERREPARRGHHRISRRLAARAIRRGGIRSELVVIAHFRELGPLVTAIVVAGRSGAGLASELATMQVSEEIDALRSMGFNPVSWLVVPRCLALVAAVPLLTWIGDVLALGGGLLATIAITDMSARAYVTSTAENITGAHFLIGMIKTPFLGLIIGLIACGQGLAARGGAAAVGARTTSAVVLAIFGVIVISTLFTLFFTMLGI
jgi:phospholipid/cholesterol/gamma-HCH transport system permease protein